MPEKNLSKKYEQVLTSGRLVDQAHHILRRAIVGWKIKPGERLFQQELAHELGVSQMIIREALGRLESEGLVIKEPYKGTKAAPHTAKDLEDLYSIRHMLEGLALELAAEQITDRELAQMRALLPETSYNPEDPSSLSCAYDNHHEFHFIAFNASHHRYLIHFIEQIWNLIDPYLIYSPDLRSTLNFEELIQSTQGDLAFHTKLVEAMEARDGRRAREINTEHVLDGLRSLKEPLRSMSQSVTG